MPSDPALVPGELLLRWRAGDKDALQALLPIVYSELRRIARNHLRRERPDHTLQTTALIHEAYLRLAQQQAGSDSDRCHFVGLTSNLMRQVLVDYARQRLAQKRQGGCRVELSDDLPVEAASTSALDVLALDAALQRLAALDPQQARVVELRYFAGLSIEDTATTLGVSPATVKRDWTTARAWLHRAIAST
jgi:RNA polymerase sigma factor (TIGR02999 family)